MEVLIVSAALDTNGQNARYVRAAEKHGASERVLAALAIGNADPAGVVGRFKAAADKSGRLVIREAHKATAYMDFPVDIVWDRKSHMQVRELAAEADLIHLNNSWRPLQMLGVHQKPVLIHHHGSLFRRDPDAMLRWARQYHAISAVSTIDLTRTAPDVLHWLPTAYDLDDLARIRNEHRRESDGLVRIVHCPTNRSLKGTDALIAAVDDLRAEGLPLELVVVERMRWVDAMRIKATADVVVDQIAFGYGCNAVEAWGMGIPVIAGADQWTTAQMVEIWGSTPYVDTSLDTLRDTLRAMVESPDMRAEWAERGLAHVQRYHAEAPALERLAELYQMTIRAAIRRTPAKLDAPIAFENPKGRRLLIDGVLLRTVDGRIVTSDPRAVERLRRMARSSWTGVVEVVA